MSAPAGEREEITQNLVDALRRGDEEAIVSVYRALSGPVYGYLLRQLRDPTWAQDLTADVFCEVLEGVDGFVGTPTGFRGWVFRIARNTMVDHFRRESYRRHGSLEAAAEAGRLPEGGEDPEARALDRLERDRVLALCDELSNDQREVLLLRLVADLPIAEVAKIVGKTPGAVKALQHRALRALADLLEES